MVSSIKKAELHLHLEGAASPDVIKRLAARHKVTLPEQLFGPNNTFAWSDFTGFLKAFDLASSVIRTPEDYRDVTYEYLAQCARENVMYVEMMASPDHAAMNGLSYTGMIEGIAQAIDDARKEHGIEGRILLTGVRHLGAEACKAVAKLGVQHPHPYVVGFGMGGANTPIKDAIPAYQVAYEEAGLPCTVHAGEMGGVPEMIDALDHLPISRIGHGVSAIHDRELIARLIDLEITLEVCPSSNVALQVFPSYKVHPLRSLLEAGVKVTLNSDDPPYFATTIGKEYEVAQQHFGFDAVMLLDTTRVAIENSFADPRLKNQLLERLPG